MLSLSKYFLLPNFLFLALVGFYCKYNILFNLSHSLPQKIFIIDVGNKNLSRGDYVAFKALGLPNTTNNTRIFKRIAGIPGDKVKVINNQVFINNKYLTEIYAKHAIWGKISPISDVTIPKWCYFVEGTAKTSFDSRYKEFGLICINQIIGKAYPYF